jgi:hypothetical protein
MTSSCGIDDEVEIDFYLHGNLSYFGNKFGD